MTFSFGARISLNGPPTVQSDRTPECEAIWQSIVGGEWLGQHSRFRRFWLANFGT